MLYATYVSSTVFLQQSNLGKKKRKDIYSTVLYLLKKNLFKWTSAIQACVAQESAVGINACMFII